MGHGKKRMQNNQHFTDLEMNFFNSFIIIHATKKRTY